MIFLPVQSGTYKNAQSHRKVGSYDPDEAAEIITLASHLLRILRTRAGWSSGGTMNHLGSGYCLRHTALVAAAGERAESCFSGILRRQHPQQAYAARLREGDLYFLTWRDSAGIVSIADVRPLHVATYVSGRLCLAAADPRMRRLRGFVPGQQPVVEDDYVNEKSIGTRKPGMMSHGNVVIGELSGADENLSDWSKQAGV